MTLYTAWRIDEKGTSHWLEGIVADSGTEAWDKGCVILKDWMRRRPGQKSVLAITDEEGGVWLERPEPLRKSAETSGEDGDRWFSFDEDTPAHFIAGALTPAQKAAVLVELLRGLQVNSVVGCLDLAADENPLILKLWMAQLEVLVRNKQMHHDEIAVRSILGNPRD